MKRHLGNGFLLVLCVLLVSRTIAAIPPAWNWDMLGYMGVALEWELDDPVDVHRETYAAAQRELPPEVFHSLTGPANAVLAARHRDPGAFIEHIAFYRARVLFSFVTSVVHRLGAPLTRAVWWLALGSFAATGGLILLWSAGRVSLAAALVAATLMLHAPPLLTSATMATVDSFGTLLLCVGVYLLIERRAHRWGAAVMTLAILARPDSVILIGILALVLFFFERENVERLSARFLGIWLALSAAAYFAVEAYAGSYGWWPLFHISFLQKEVHPAAIDSSVDWGTWWSVIGSSLANIPVDIPLQRNASPGVGYWSNPRGVNGSSFVFVYAGFAVLALALWQRAPVPARLRRHAAFLVALLATYLVRWLLFPELWDRFFAPLYVLVPLCLLSMAAIALEAPEHQKPSYESRPPMTSS